MRFRITLLLLLSCVPLTARADDASKLAKIQEFFKVAKLDQLSNQGMKQAIDQVNSGITQQLLGVKLTADQQKSYDGLTKKAETIISNALSWDKLEPEYEKLYAAAYTEPQLDDILAFYKSPTGRVMVEKTPVLIAQAKTIAQQRLMDAVPQLQQLMKDFAAQQATQAPHASQTNQPNPKQ